MAPDYLRRGWTLVAGTPAFQWARAHWGRILLTISLILLGAYLVGCLLAWLAGSPPPNTNAAGDEKKAEYREAEQQATNEAAEHHEAGGTARQSADTTRRERKAIRAKTNANINAIRAAPDDRQPDLYRPLRDRARAAADEYNRERAGDGDPQP
jgi:hypothetical protein